MVPHRLRRMPLVVLALLAWVAWGCRSEQPKRAELVGETASKASTADAPQKRPSATAPRAAAQRAALDIPPYEPNDPKRIGAKRRAEAKRLNTKGFHAYGRKDFDAAIGFFVEALRRNPGHVLARYNLACNLALTGREERALELLGELRDASGCKACRRQLVAAGRDADFLALKDDPRFRAVALPPAPVSLGIDETRLKRFAELRFIVRGLPAVSSDGRRIAHAHQTEDGLRGDPNLALLIFDTSTGAVLSRRLILGADEVGDNVLPLRGKIRARLTRANAELAGSSWEPLAAAGKAIAAAPCTGKGPSVSALEVGGLRFSYDEPELTVHGRGGAVLLKRRCDDWKAPASCAFEEPLEGCEQLCRNPAFLKALHFDPRRRVGLVVVGYCGDHTCPGPDSRVELLRVPEK